MTKVYKLNFKGKEIIATNDGLDTLQLLVSGSMEDYPPQLSMSASGDYSDRENPTEEKIWIIEDLEPGDSFEFSYLKSGVATEPVQAHKIDPFVEQCFFCGKSKDDVEVLIEGKEILTSYICNECVEKCVDVIKEEREKKKNT